jgi:hypothetical protein
VSLLGNIKGVSIKKLSTQGTSPGHPVVCALLASEKITAKTVSLVACQILKSAELDLANFDCRSHALCGDVTAYDDARSKRNRNVSFGKMHKMHKQVFRCGNSVAVQAMNNAHAHRMP